MNVPPWARLPQRRPRSRQVRGDIQGLRALAVVLVIANHVIDEPVGGFLGVDVFFVLSGFLITGLLVREHQREGRIGYLAFYRRRVRRIVPVATLVLAVTIVATSALYTTERVREVAVDAAWAFGFAANWHFAGIGTDYFAAGGPLSPLQHYWSLSVEEQFYVVWPTLVLVCLWAAGRRNGSRRTGTLVLLAVTLLVTFGSFGYSLLHSQGQPVNAYFSTFDRAWELAAGAAIAVVSPWLHRLTPTLRPLLLWGGLGAVAAAVVVVDEQSTFPAPWAALPVAGTCLVLISGTGGRARFSLPLDNPLTRYLGDISYSLYLWHFPVVVLALAFAPQRGTAYVACVLALTLGLSVLSFHLVEDPVRRSRWLEPRRHRVFLQGPTNHSRGLANAWLAVGVLAAVGLTALVVRAPEAPRTESVLAVAPQPPAPAVADGSAPVSEPTSDTPEAYLQERIQQSLSFQDFPELDPPVDDLGLPAWFEAAADYGCVSVAPALLDDCVFGDEDAPGSAVVVGDSFAIAYMPALREALGSRFRVQQLTLQECPPFDAETDHFAGGAYPECAEFRDYTRKTVKKLDPDLVVVVSSFTYADRAMSSGATGPDAFDEIEAGLARAVEQLSAPDRVVVILGPPPGAGNLLDCVTAVSSPSDCERDVPGAWYDMTDLEKRVAEATGTQYVDPRPWFCVEQYCPGFVGTTPVYADGGRLTVAYAEQLGDVVFDALLAAAEAAQVEAGTRPETPTGPTESQADTETGSAVGRPVPSPTT